MGKPVDKTDAIAKKLYGDLDRFSLDEQFKRKEKRVWKKHRTRHLRAKAKQDLRERQDDVK